MRDKANSQSQGSSSKQRAMQLWQQFSTEHAPANLQALDELRWAPYVYYGRVR